MEIWHKLALNRNIDSKFVDELDRLRLKYKSSKIPAIGYNGKESELISFEISESNPHWLKISCLMSEHGISGMVETFFNKEEILKTKWLRLIPVNERGYPQPANDYWYNNPSNDFSCPKCGIYRQVKPYRITSNITIKDNEFISLYWTYSLFCNIRLLDEIKNHHINGFEDWKTIIYSTDQPSNNIHQLYIPNIAKPGLVENDLKKVKCDKCGEIKYYPHKRGIMYFKKDSLLKNLDFQLSYEWFGSGGIAYKEIVVSNRMARLILEKGWKGIRFKIIELI